MYSDARAGTRPCTGVHTHTHTDTRIYTYTRKRRQEKRTQKRSDGLPGHSASPHNSAPMSKHIGGSHAHLNTDVHANGDV